MYIMHIHPIIIAFVFGLSSSKEVDYYPIWISDFILKLKSDRCPNDQIMLTNTIYATHKKNQKSIKWRQFIIYTLFPQNGSSISNNTTKIWCTSEE